jgi:putative membrane-bound dehydrogenase-like protein
VVLGSSRPLVSQTLDEPLEEVLVRGEHYNLTPQEAEAAMEVQEGFQIRLFASEPDIRQPNAFCIDDRGRLWVGENYTYTKVGWKPDSRDRILIFTDSDGDGRFDQRRVFTDNITYVSGIEVGYGGVWVGSPPNLVFIPDRDGDDVPDGQPEVVLDGWGAQDQHETLNTFKWGPDGWLYGCHGVFTHSLVGKPGTPDEQRVPINAGVWRYHPIKERFEVYAWGTSNPWGIDWDQNGQMFMTACVIPHLWHVIQGGRYHRQAGEHFDPYVYDDIKTIADHSHQEFKGREGGFAHGGAMIYQGESFPERYRGKLFMFNIHHRSIYIDRLQESSGSAFEGSHDEDFLFANDPWFIGFAMDYAPGGSVYLIDWYDQEVCHGQTPAGKATGRIYRISYGDTVEPQVDLASATNAELAAYQLGDNQWYVRHARRILAERAHRGVDMTEVVEQLRSTLLSDAPTPKRLQSLWTMHVVGAAGAELLASLLQDADPYVRGWAIQLGLEDQQLPAGWGEKLAVLARQDPSPRVRLYLASALQRMSLDDRWAIAEGLVEHAQDASDHNLELMYWYGIEPLVAQDRARALTLAAKCAVPAGESTRPLRKYIARRVAQR